MLRPRRRPTISLVFALTGTLVLGAGFAGISAAPAEANDRETDSALTVKWAGDAGAAQPFQPERDEKSVHYKDFKNVEVRVEQTENLTDQRVKVHVTGMPGATGKHPSNSQRTVTNYVQAMQCWGDPLSADFPKTCQWGGHTVNPADVANDMMAWNLIRSFGSRLPFLTVLGEELSEKDNPLGIAGKEYNRAFTADTSNEVLAARMSAGGKGTFDFETQTSNAAPHMGCGLPQDEFGAGERCWLVIVPRGVHSSLTGGEQCRAPNNTSKVLQAGSPIDPDCEYWNNRIVVPLDFQPTGGTCAVGAAERPVAGSDLVSAAVSSWQPTLCKAEGAATYNFAAMPDSVARDQLLTGQSRFVLTGSPLTADTVSADLAEELSTAKFAYAPVAVTAPAVSFLATDFAQGRLEMPLNLTPRLLAKMLTQSYMSHAPSYTGDHPPYLTNNVNIWTDDPEFRALNSEWVSYAREGSFRSSTMPGLIMVPNASDSNAQLWRWIQADSKARAFLSGEPDNLLPGDDGNHGMKVNPNYLPKGHPDATMMAYAEEQVKVEFGEGTYPGLVAQPNKPRVQIGLAREDDTPYSLATTLIDTIPRAEAWAVPRILRYRETSRFDTTQFNPGRSSLKEVATDIARNRRKSLSNWDPIARNAAGESGAWVAAPANYQGNSIMMGITSTSSAELFALNSVRLQLPDKPGVYVAPDNASMTAALDAAADAGQPGVTQVVPAKVGAGAYPLTQIVWGAMRLDGSSAEERTDYANFIEYATTKGQEPGTSAGQLPAGYAPLTSEMRAQAAAAVAKIRAYVPPAEGGNDGPGDGTDDDGTTPDGGMNPNTTPPNGLGGNTPGGSIDNDTLTPANQPTAQLGNTPEEASGTHTAAPVGVFSVLGGTLLLGLSGAAASPALLRRRDTAPL